MRSLVYMVYIFDFFYASPTFPFLMPASFEMLLDIV
ncbi:hypothetical protein Nwat_1283 [Nitrosococcus watsonii C-113]|uniref:Uncharacterized protein n=1 Tax=Nitrosococcus watsoni (strain C-113) TaxID=105559 RepID=D8K5N2_NITWC|nr:hypothetical protein Nwat_1283 [Nitrosococcus watsonii C-113]